MSTDLGFLSRNQELAEYLRFCAARIDAFREGRASVQASFRRRHARRLALPENTAHQHPRVV